MHPNTSLARYRAAGHNAQFVRQLYYNSGRSCPRDTHACRAIFIYLWVAERATGFSKPARSQSPHCPIAKNACVDFHYRTCSLLPAYRCFDRLVGVCSGRGAPRRRPQLPEREASKLRLKLNEVGGRLWCASGVLLFVVCVFVCECVLARLCMRRIFARCDFFFCERLVSDISGEKGRPLGERLVSLLCLAIGHAAVTRRCERLGRRVRANYGGQEGSIGCRLGRGTGHGGLSGASVTRDPVCCFTHPRLSRARSQFFFPWFFLFFLFLFWQFAPFYSIL